MILALTHPDYLQSPDRLDMYKSLLMFLKEISAWFCLPRDMTKWWMNKKLQNI